MTSDDIRPVKGLPMTLQDLVPVAIVASLFVLWVYVLPRMGVG